MFGFVSIDGCGDAIAGCGCPRKCFGHCTCARNTCDHPICPTSGTSGLGGLDATSYHSRQRRGRAEDAGSSTAAAPYNEPGVAAMVFVVAPSPTPSPAQAPPRVGEGSLKKALQISLHQPPPSFWPNPTPPPQNQPTPSGASRRELVWFCAPVPRPHLFEVLLFCFANHSICR